MHKSGFVNIIGNPNVGKSTLMNALVGERLSIITSKAQTTRHRIMGIVNGEDFQIVYSDTPGILKPSYKLQESMMKFVKGAVSDADVILYVTDTVEQSDRSAEIVERIAASGIPTIVVVNKIDLTTPDKLEALVEKWHAILPNAEIAPASAKEGFNIGGIFDSILRLLPRRRTFLPERYAYGQNPAVLRIGDHTRKDTAQLRQGDTLLLRNSDRQLQGGADHRPYCRDNLRYARLAKGDNNRSPRRNAQESGYTGPHRPREIPRQKSIPRTLRQGRRRLAQCRTATRRFGYEQD